MSALSNCVTCGIVFHAWLRCSATSCGARRSSPRARPRPTSRSRAARASGRRWRRSRRRLAARCRSCVITRFANSFTSSCEMRPPGPLPGDLRRCRRRSRAPAGGRTARPGAVRPRTGRRQRDRRPAGARPRCPPRRPADAPSRQRAQPRLPGAGVATGAGAAASACGGLRLRRRAGHALIDDQHGLPELHLVARLHADLRDDAGQRGRHLDGGLVGFELEHRLVDRQRRRPASPAPSGTSPCATFSPRFGSLNSMAMSPVLSDRSAVMAGFGFSGLMPRSLIALATTRRRRPASPRASA